MIFSAARGLFSAFHGAISTGLDVLTGIHPKPRDTLNQEQAEKIKAREDQDQKARRRAIARQEAIRRAQMHGIFGQKQHKHHQSRSRR